MYSDTREIMPKNPAYIHLETNTKETDIFVLIHTVFSICLYLKHAVLSLYAAAWHDNYPEKIK